MARGKKRPKIAIIYVSTHHKNTEKVAIAMSDAIHAETFTIPQSSKVDLSKYDLIGFGSGIYEADFHRHILDIIEKNDLKDKNVFIFSTSGVKQNSILKNKFNHNILNTLSRKQARILGAFSCRGKDTAGPLVRLVGGVNKKNPSKSDLQRAREFAKEIVKRM